MASCWLHWRVSFSEAVVTACRWWLLLLPISGFLGKTSARHEAPPCACHTTNLIVPAQLLQLCNCQSDPACPPCRLIASSQYPVRQQEMYNHENMLCKLERKES
jgi:hypothetical protein